MEIRWMHDLYEGTAFPMAGNGRADTRPACSHVQHVTNEYCDFNAVAYVDADQFIAVAVEFLLLRLCFGFVVSRFCFLIFLN